MKELPVSLAKWHDYPQFILCKLIPREGGKIDKVPVDVSGIPINPHAPDNWMSATEAIATAELLGFEVGFVFTAADPFWFLDIDHCIDPETRNYNQIAQALLKSFPGAATEISSGGDGLHLFGTGQVPEHSSKNKQWGIEFYTEGRFVLLTGTGAKGDAWLDWTAQAPWLVESYFPPKAATCVIDWTNDSPAIEDEVMYEKVMNAKPKFGGRASVADLMEGNEASLARNYPPINPTDPYDRSSADHALANHLAFWTGKNHGQIWRLMWRSALRREKWNPEGKHKNYLATTISNAVDGCTNVYGNGNREAVVGLGEEAVVRLGGDAFMSPHQQIEFFKDCCYVTRNHGVLVPSGGILKPDQFKAVYGGYNFSLDSQNSKSTTNPWTAFIDNQAVTFPRVDGIRFDPKAEPRKIIIEDRMKLINTFVPLNIKRIKGDVTLFLDHMHKLFPDENDRQIILSYMAAMVQHQGVKFQWCPIIQGAEGNGKSLLSRVLEAAIGSRYCHTPKASDLASGGIKFNGWIEGKIAIFIPELFSNERFSLVDAMKTMITDDRIEVQFKGKDQYTTYVVANFLMMSNHKDPIKITYDQRRYFMIYTPQQTEADINRDGMGGNYFKRIYDWLKNHDGYAMVSDYLWTYEIPAKYNPAGDCQRAPISTSIHEAVYATMGNVEQHIMEAIEEERQGFRGGYISSKCLDILLRDLKMDNKYSPHRRLSIIESLGYAKHPWLNKGRVDNPVASEGTKPTLYYKGELPDDTQYAPSWVKEDYELKQGYINPGENLKVVK